VSNLKLQSNENIPGGLNASEMCIYVWTLVCVLEIENSTLLSFTTSYMNYQLSEMKQVSGANIFDYNHVDRAGII
jgi:hypothetical protein